MKQSLAVLVALLLVACGGASGGREIAISQRELSGGQQSLEPKTVTIKAGEKVIFVVKNEGAQDHEFESDEASIEEIVVPPGKVRRVTWQASSKAGTYPIYCDLPGHRAAGMELSLVVE